MPGQFGNSRNIIGWTARVPVLPDPPFIVPVTSAAIVYDITGLTYAEGDGPSDPSAAFQVIADGLSPAAGDITLTPGTDIEVWDGSTWTSLPFTIPYTGGAITTLPIYMVRLRAGLSEGPVVGVLILSGADAAPFQIDITGTIAPPAGDFLKDTGGNFVLQVGTTDKVLIV